MRRARSEIREAASRTRETTAQTRAIIAQADIGRGKAMLWGRIRFAEGDYGVWEPSAEIANRWDNP